MKNSIFLIGYKDPNRYSWSTLLASVENDRMLEKTVNFHIISKQLYKVKEFPNMVKYRHVVLGFSLLTAQMPKFNHFMQNTYPKLKALYDNVWVIVGGPHPTARPDECLGLGADFAVVGEGELALSHILHYIVDLSKKSLEGFSFPLVYTKFTKRGAYTPQDIQLLDLDKYPPYSEKFRLFGPIEITRGCPYACKYCQTSSLFSRVRHASIDAVYQWVKRAVEIKYDRCWFISPNSFAYCSPTSKPNIDALTRFFEKMSSIEGLTALYFGTFPGEVRPESVTEEVLELLQKYVANDKITIGAQTISNSLLKHIGRSHTFEDVMHAIELCKQYKINVDLDLIFDLPGETEEDILITLDFLDKVENDFHHVRIHGHAFMPLPGTAFEHEQRGRLDPRIHSKMGRLSMNGKGYGSYEKQARK